MSGMAERIATCFGVGRWPVAPGTWGSLVAVPFAWIIELVLGAEALWLAALAAALAGVWAGGAVAARTGKADPPEVVIDEVAGQWLALAVVATFTGELALLAMGIGFLAFRFFDIAKIYPANKAEQFGGGWGVMADDLVAGAYAGVTTIVVLMLIKWFG